MSILRRLVTSFCELTPKERQSVVLVVGLSIESLIWIREMNAVDKLLETAEKKHEAEMEKVTKLWKKQRQRAIPISGSDVTSS
ncbi:unnamed protein product [Rhodiola kirilowii]